MQVVFTTAARCNPYGKRSPYYSDKYKLASTKLLHGPALFCMLLSAGSLLGHYITVALGDNCTLLKDESPAAE